ncbi:fibronectin type III domain-containing protein [candidate division WOR-3 bacterium]|nr:fibronectin type III domain-containing protein [candidate division WOR-3 bacterium]
MNRTVLTILMCTAMSALLVVLPSCGVLGGPPTAVAVSSGPGESDSTVVIAWTAPAEGGPDKYIVHFRAVTESAYTVLGETTATSYNHNPHTITGRYKVTAVFGAEAYDGEDKPTTVPVRSQAVSLFEINTDSSKCGYGWTRDSGRGGVFGMTDTLSSRKVDFYISDLQAGSGNPLYVVSPNKADTIDPGAIGIVPKADWRRNGFTDSLSADHAVLPSYRPPPNATYFIYNQIPQAPFYIGCYTAGEEEKHFALIQVNSKNEATGRVQLETWYQLVPGLRLVRH